MADGFKTPSGALAVVGLMGLPLWLWACRYEFNPSLFSTTAVPFPLLYFALTLLHFRYMPGSLCASPFLGVLVIIGRLVCASVEVWVLCAHTRGLLKQDMLDCGKSVGTQTAKQT